MTNYHIGDFLIRLKNQALAENKKSLEVRETKLIKAVSLALKDSGILESVDSKKGFIEVKLAYKRKKPVLIDLKLVSKPGLRIYMDVKELEKIKRPSLFLVSTPKGVMPSSKAIKQRLGGEVLVEIW